MSSTNAAEIEHAAGGRFRGPETLYKNVTKSALASIDNSFLASKGRVRASDSRLEAVDSRLEAELQEYKNETTTVIKGLVGKLNAMTPVGI